MQNGKGDRNRSDPKKYAKGWDFIFERCPEHPRYQAVHKPTARCAKCWEIYRRKHPLVV